MTEIEEHKHKQFIRYLHEKDKCSDELHAQENQDCNRCVSITDQNLMKF